MQWVLGVGDLKLPGSLLDGGSDPNLEVMEASMKHRVRWLEHLLCASLPELPRSDLTRIHG